MGKYLAVLLAFATAQAADWPRFRGPNGSGVTDTSELPAQFAPGKNMLWKTPLPFGHSSPVLSGDRLFLTGIEDGKLYTICLDRDTGKILWRRECPRLRKEVLDSRNSPASPTPAADGKAIYVFFCDFGMVSYDYSGTERWRAPLGPFRNIYGMGVSPIVVDDKVILVCDQSQGSFIVALGKDDGKVRWRKPRPEALSGHSTPIVYQPAGGRPAQILAPGSFRIDAYSVDDGESVWWVEGLPSEMKSVPALVGDMLYISGYSAPENDPGNHVTIPPFEEVLAKSDTNKDGRVSLEEAPDKRTKAYFPVLDLNHDGQLDAQEWKVYQALMSAENGLLAYHIGGRGDLTPSSLRWKYQRSVPQLPSVLIYQGVLYMINDGGILTTLNADTGEVFKQGRLRGAIDHYFSSPVAADGKVFFISQSGIVTVLKAGGDQQILNTNELDDECYATPAIADGRIYVRTRSALYSFGKRD